MQPRLYGLLFVLLFLGLTAARQPHRALTDQLDAVPVIELDVSSSDGRSAPSGSGADALAATLRDAPGLVFASAYYGECCAGETIKTQTQSWPLPHLATLQLCS